MVPMRELERHDAAPSECAFCRTVRVALDERRAARGRAEDIEVAGANHFGACRIWPSSFLGAPTVRQTASVGIDRGAAFNAAGLDLLTRPRFLIAGRHIARIGGEAGAARIAAIDNGWIAGSICVTNVRVAWEPIVAVGIDGGTVALNTVQAA